MFNINCEFWSTGDMYKADEGVEDDQEPDWVKDEKERFSGYRDKDQDGFMDTEEVKINLFYQVIY